MRVKKKSRDQVILEKAFKSGEIKARGMILKITRDINSVDDILQITYMKAWKNQDRFKGDSSLETWICAIAKNEALCFLKKKRRYAIHLESISHKAEIATKITDVPYYELLASNLEKAMNALPSDKLRIVLKKKALGFSEREIAEELGVTEGSVKSRYRRAKEYLVKHSKEIV